MSSDFRIVTLSTSIVDRITVCRVDVITQTVVPGVRKLVGTYDIEYNVPYTSQDDPNLLSETYKKLHTLGVL